MAIIPASSAVSVAPASPSEQLLEAKERENAELRRQVEQLQRQLRQRSADDCGALADVVADVPRSMPMIIDQVNTVRHVARIWVNIIAPQEALGDTWRSTKTFGGGSEGRKQMKKWSHQINENYIPIMLCVMEEHAKGISLADACDKVQSFKGNDTWTAFLKRVPGPLADQAKAARDKKQPEPGKDVPPRDESTQERYMKMLLDPALKERTNAVNEQSTALALTSTAQASAVSTSSEPAVSSGTPVAVPPAIPAVHGASRYLGLDPSKTCGWAVVDVVDQQVVSVAVGVVDVNKVKGSLGRDYVGIDHDGARCKALLQELAPLLDLSPQHVYIEDYNFNCKSAQGCRLNFAFRGCLKLDLERRRLSYSSVGQSEWKKALTFNGNATKPACKEELVRRFGSEFPGLPNTPIGAMATEFELNASDAVCICLAGLRGRGLSYAAPVCMSAPLLTQDAGARGKKRARE